VVCYGARTLSKVSPDKYVSLRRTLNYLKTSLKNLSGPSIFEPNDERLWVKLNMTLTGFLSDFWRSGGLKGAKASDAFYVVCDSTNNTANSIDQGIVNITVGVALSYPAEFIVINISQWTGGSNVVESI
jgi:phage tail sheath protein FI